MEEIEMRINWEINSPKNLQSVMKLKTRLARQIYSFHLFTCPLARQSILDRPNGTSTNNSRSATLLLDLL